MDITVSLTDAEAGALSVVATDVHQWAQNALTARADAAIYEVQQAPSWAQALASAAAAKVDVSDAGAVLLHGLSVGIIKTAAQAEADAAAARAAQATTALANAKISPRQFWVGLAGKGLITQDEALAAIARTAIPAALLTLIAALPADQQFAAKASVLGASEFIRSDPLVAQLAAAEGWTEAQTDAFWAYCATL